MIYYCIVIEVFFLNIFFIYYNEIFLLLLYFLKFYIISFIIRIRGNVLFVIILLCIIGFIKSEFYYFDVFRYFGGFDIVVYIFFVDF